MSRINRTGKRRDYEIVRGTTIDETFSIVTPEGQQADTTGFTAHCAFRFGRTGETINAETFLIGSTVRFLVPHADTERFDPSVKYQLELRSADIRRAILWGTFSTTENLVN